MAIEGIVGAASNYQTTPQVKSVSSSESSPKANTYTGSDVVTSGVNGTVRVVENAGEAGNGSENSENQSQQERQPSEATMKQALNDINKRLNNTECRFGIHDKTNRVTIQIIDKDTQEVIKELPPEKTLDMIAKAWELAGLLVDEKL